MFFLLDKYIVKRIELLYMCYTNTYYCYYHHHQFQNLLKFIRKLHISHHVAHSSSSGKNGPLGHIIYKTIKTYPSLTLRKTVLQRHQKDEVIS